MGQIQYDSGIFPETESEERYRTLFDQVPDPYAVLGADGRLLDVNRAAIQMSGKSKVELVGKTLSETGVMPEGFQRVSDDRLQRTLEGEILQPIVMTARGPGGATFYVEVRELKVAYNGQPAVLSISRDVTQSKNAEQERASLEEQLRQAQKLEAIGQLAGGVAHDFNNLLQAINGNAELARIQLKQKGECVQELDEIVKASERAAALTKRLLAFSRRQVMTLRYSNLNDVVHSLYNMVGRLIGEHIRLSVVQSKKLGTVHCDVSQIEQVLINLCVNARDAIEGTGNITIETENVLVDEEYCASHAWASHGRFVLLSVTDNGHGIEPDNLEKVFEPFFTTKDVGKGSGLGLAMVYGIVRQHDGMINVYSEPGVGTTFKIYLPIVEMPVSAVGHKIESKVVGGQETILLAEDNDAVRNTSRRMLEKGGYRVIVAEDGVDALRVWQNHRNEIHMALLDVVMPQMGGREVYEEIKTKDSSTKFLFTSGYSENVVHTDFLAAEGVQLIQKPYSSSDLLRKVREVLDYQNQ